MDALLGIRDLALRIARDAGTIPAQAQPRTHAARTLRTETKSSEFDLVTELDSATELAITSAIRAERPGDGILGEEGAASASSTGYTWVIDPIDGTVNYFYGHPHWCICIGVVDAVGDPVVGVVHAPMLGETFVAARGHGAHLVLGDEWQPLAPPPAVELSRALLATGFAYDQSRRIDMARVFADFVPRVRDMRRGGAAGLDIAFVAAGRIHGYYERDLKPWDRTAGFAIAHEVGIEPFFTGAAMGPNLTVVAPGALSVELRAELSRLGVLD